MNTGDEEIARRYNIGLLVRNAFAIFGLIGSVLFIAFLFGIKGTRYGDLSAEERCLTKSIGKKDERVEFDENLKSQIESCGLRFSNIDFMMFSSYEGGQNILGSWNRRLSSTIIEKENGAREVFWSEEIQSRTWLPIP